MKPEKEFYYIILLLNSKYIKGFFSTNKACKTDLQKVCKAPNNDTTFNKWLDQLIQEGSLEKAGTIDKGRFVKAYFINEKKLLQRFNINPLYKPSHDHFNRDRVI